MTVTVQYSLQMEEQNQQIIEAQTIDQKLELSSQRLQTAIERMQTAAQSMKIGAQGLHTAFQNLQAIEHNSGNEAKLIPWKGGPD